MKFIPVLLFFLGTFCPLFAQTPLNKELFAHTEKLIDIELTDAERDSLIGQAQNYLQTYKVMHGQKIDNAVPMALYFDPSPTNRDVNTAKMPNLAQMPSKPTVWEMSNSLEMPKNKENLAFYSLPQLASLIKNKKSATKSPIRAL